MKSMQRQFGRLMSRGPGDNAKVSALLNDYEDVDKVLAKVVDDAKMWKDSWVSIVCTQLQVVTEYDGLYDPVVGASDWQSRQAVPTPQFQLERTFKLKQAYGELKTELLEEVASIELSVIRPASDARDLIAPIRKTIHKRENKRLDFERAQDRALKLQRKPGRTQKEDAALAKAETEVARAADEFGVADEHLRQTLPPIIDATFSLVPPLVSNLILIQTRLLGLYYTTLHNYCAELGFPSPPPPMETVIATWNSAFSEVRKQVESIGHIARGKAVQQPVSATHGVRMPSAQTSFDGSSSRAVSGLISGPKSRALRAPAPSPSLHEFSITPSSSQMTPTGSHSQATDFTTASILGGASVVRSLAATEPHLTNAGRPAGLVARVSNSSSSSSSSSNKFPSKTGSSAANTAGNLREALPNAAAAATAKKKPPPPPPPKRTATARTPEDFVVAQYAFSGEGDGDLAFHEGDKIRVVKRTGTDQDWWVGELRGVTGNFPANYCKPCLD